MAMQYISEINAFYRRQAVAPLSAYGHAMWHYLIYRANQAGWQMPLQIGEPEILGACTMGHDTFCRVRKELVDGDYIRHVQQPGRKRPHYYIVSHAIPKINKE